MQLFFNLDCAVESVARHRKPKRNAQLERFCDVSILINRPMSNLPVAGKNREIPPRLDSKDYHVVVGDYCTIWVKQRRNERPKSERILYICFRLPIETNREYPFCFLICHALLSILKTQFQNAPFAQSLRQVHVLVLEILNVFLWLKFSPPLTFNKIGRFEAASKCLRIHFMSCCHGGCFVHYF